MADTADLAAFWRSLCIENDNVWARLQNGAAGAASRLAAQKIGTVGALLKAEPEKVEKALPGITAEELQQVRAAARAWLGKDEAPAAAQAEAEQVDEGVKDGGGSGTGAGSGSGGGTA